MAWRLRIGVDTLDRLERGELPSRLGVGIFFRIERVFGVSPERQLSQRLGE